MKFLQRMIERFEVVTKELAIRDKFFEEVGAGTPDWRGIINIGWIRGRLEDRRFLRQIGVRGRMRYSRDAFEQCIASDEVIRRLLVMGRLDYISFTTVNMVTGVQLPPRKQKWWRWPSENQLKWEGYVPGYKPRK